MGSRNWPVLLGAVLILSAAPLLYNAGAPPSAQTTAKTTSSKSKKKSKTKPKSKAQTAPTPDRIKEIQTALQRDGAYDGEPTGKWDDSTVDAMKKYQDKNGLNATGKIDAPTLNKLGLG